MKNTNTEIKNGEIIKFCGWCKIKKPAREFYKDIWHGNKFNLSSHCKECTNHHQSIKRNDITRQKERIWRRKHRQQNEYVRLSESRKAMDWQKKNKEKRLSHTAVYRALKKGILEKPDKCEWHKCRVTYINAHHNDYNEQLKIIWLCHQHHFKMHKIIKIK